MIDIHNILKMKGNVNNISRTFSREIESSQILFDI